MHSSRWLMFTCLLLMTALWGCSDDSTTPETRTDLTADQAEDWSRSSLEMINSMVAEVPDIAAGTMITLGPAKAAGEPVWDAAQMAWVYTAQMDMDDGEGSSTTLTMDYWIQYRSGDGPLPTALGATEVEFRLAQTMVMDAQSPDGSAHIEYHTATTMLIGYGDSAYTVDGSGTAAVVASQTAGGSSERLAFSMAWGLDLAQPMAGCPAGTVWIETDPYRMDAVYDGLGGVAWTLIGPGYTASGSETLACSALQ